MTFTEPEQDHSRTCLEQKEYAEQFVSQVALVNSVLWSVWAAAGVHPVMAYSVGRDNVLNETLLERSTCVSGGE